jgi:hypothetical protein
LDRSTILFDIVTPQCFDLSAGNSVDCFVDAVVAAIEANRRRADMTSAQIRSLAQRTILNSGSCANVNSCSMDDIAGSTEGMSSGDELLNLVASQAESRVAPEGSSASKSSGGGIGLIAGAAGGAVVLIALVALYMVYGRNGEGRSKSGSKHGGRLQESTARSVVGTLRECMLQLAGVFDLVFHCLPWP